MYLHLGQDYVVHTRDIIGIFDIAVSYTHLTLPTNSRV